MPQATRTRGLTMPQPAISIQPWLRQTRHGSAPRLGGLAAADVALHGHVGGRLGEREVVRPQPGPQAGAEQRVDERLDRAAQVGHGQALVHRQALDLVEDRQVGGVQRLVPVDLARAHHVERQRPGEQAPDLHGRGVGAQHHAPGGDPGTPRQGAPLVAPRGDEQGVLHLPRRVVGQEVKRVEVVPLGLDLWPLGDLVAHRDEHVGELVGEHADRVAGTLRRAVVGQRDVDALGDQHLLVALVLKLLLACRQRVPDARDRGADPAARVGAGLRRQRADLGARQGERRLVPGVRDLGFPELVQGPRAGYRG